MCSFEENSWLFDEKERAKGPKAAFPQQGSPKSDRLLGRRLTWAGACVCGVCGLVADGGREVLVDDLVEIGTRDRLGEVSIAT